MAATHLVPNPFDPRTSGPPLPVPMDKWSPKIWSPWTNGPQIFGPHGQMVPDQFGPGGQKVGDRKSGDQMGSGPNVSQSFE